MKTASLLLVALLLPVICFAQTTPPTSQTQLADVQLDSSTLRVHYIDVGAGMAALVELPNSGLRIFIDGGKAKNADLKEYLDEFIDDDRIDIAIVTHPDFDHLKGMRLALKEYDVGEFWYTGYASRQTRELENWNKLLKEVKKEPGLDSYNPLEDWVSVCEYELLDDRGTDTEDDDIWLQYLNIDSSPPNVDPLSGRHFEESEQRNSASLVFKIVYGDVSFLFTGDINGRPLEDTEPEHDDLIDSEEFELLTRHLQDPEYCDLTSTVLQSPHHGSNGANSLFFLQAVDPEWIVIPAGHAYNHPTPATLRRMGLAGIAADHILRTDEGDTTPETASSNEDKHDDSFIFETDGNTITRVWWVEQ